MAKKKTTKTVKKASKSSGSKKKATKSAGGAKSRASSTKKKSTAAATGKAAKTTKKKTTKKKVSASRSKKTTTAAKSAAPTSGAAKPTKAGSTKPGSLNGPAPKAHNGESVEWTPAKLRKVKTGLGRKDYAYFLGLLLEKRAEIMGDVAGLEAARRAQDGDISHVPLHMADVGSDNYEQEFTLGLMESERKLVHDIDEAISRIQDKTFGVCIESGEPIPRARLEIKPWARYTIDVVRERERRGLPV